LDPTAQLIANLREENEQLKLKMEGLGGSTSPEAQSLQNERAVYEAKLAEADEKLRASDKAYQEMKAKVLDGERPQLGQVPFTEADQIESDKLEEEVAALRTQVAQCTENLDEWKIKNELLQEKVRNRDVFVAAARVTAALARKPEQASLQERAVTMQRSRTTELREVSEAQREAEAVTEKQTVELLLELHMRELEELVRERDAARVAANKAREEGSTDSCEFWEAKVSGLELAIEASRQEYQQMETLAGEAGNEKKFRAAGLAVEKHEKEAQAKFMDWNVAQKRSSGATEESLSSDLQAIQELKRSATVLDEEARQATQAALQEAKEARDLARQEREEALSKMAEARERLGLDEAELRERQEAIEAIIEWEQQSFEEKLKESVMALDHLKSSFDDMGLSVDEILGAFKAGGHSVKESMPYFVNLNEDAHQDGLIYLIVDGETRVTHVDSEDAEDKGIKLDGTSIRKHHATICCDEVSRRVTIAVGGLDAMVFINGEKLYMQPKLLEHGARVIFGNDFIFRYVDPRAKTVRRPIFDGKGHLAIVDWQFAAEELQTASGIPIAKKGTGEDAPSSIRPRASAFGAAVASAEQPEMKKEAEYKASLAKVEKLQQQLQQEVADKKKLQGEVEKLQQQLQEARGGKTSRACALM